VSLGFRVRVAPKSRCRRAEKRYTNGDFRYVKGKNCVATVKNGAQFFVPWKNQ